MGCPVQDQELDWIFMGCFQLKIFHESTPIPRWQCGTKVGAGAQPRYTGKGPFPWRDPCSADGSLRVMDPATPAGTGGPRGRRQETDSTGTDCREKQRGHHSVTGRAGAARCRRTARDLRPGQRRWRAGPNAASKAAPPQLRRAVAPPGGDRGRHLTPLHAGIGRCLSVT